MCTKGASGTIYSFLFFSRVLNAVFLAGMFRRSHWFHTIMMSRTELDRVFNNTAMKKRSVLPFFFCMLIDLVTSGDRTHRFAILAMSLSSLFDIVQPTDCLRSALNMLIEYEQAKEENDRPKMVPRPSCLSSPTTYCRQHS